MEEMNENEISIKLKKFHNETEIKVKNEALASRAYADKLSIETINNKVTSQENSIQFSINEINPRFNEKSKHYNEIREMISNSLINYENALMELSHFYDGKIEQLILRKVELESSLVGAIINNEYLFQQIDKKNKQKSNDKVKKSITENIKQALDSLLNRKKEKTTVDVAMMSKILDNQDVEKELEISNEKSYEDTIEEKNLNQKEIEKIEKEIYLTNNEIERINNQKVKSLVEAMEIGDKGLTQSIKKPKAFKKITRFFISRFNTAKVIQNSIIIPFDNRIEEFKVNELANIS